MNNDNQPDVPDDTKHREQITPDSWGFNAYHSGISRREFILMNGAED